MPQHHPTEELAGKVAVITGGSTGIGRATGVLFASLGMKVVLAARRTDRLAVAVDGIRAAGHQVLGVPTDVADYDSVRRLADASFDTFGTVDVLFLNAGFAVGDRLIEPDMSAWRDSFETNVYGLLHGIKASVPRMLERSPYGSVLATSSGAGAQGTMVNSGPYATTKLAQVSIMESLYGQLRDAGSTLHVGVVLPPLVNTNLAGDEPGRMEWVRDSEAAKGHPMALIEPADFAQVVLEGVLDRTFWIDTTREQDDRLLAGQLAVTIDRNETLVRAKAESMINRTPPDPYLRR